MTSDELSAILGILGDLTFFDSTSILVFEFICTAEHHIRHSSLE